MGSREMAQHPTTLAENLTSSTTCQLSVLSNSGSREPDPIVWLLPALGTQVVHIHARAGVHSCTSKESNEC